MISESVLAVFRSPTETGRMVLKNKKKASTSMDVPALEVKVLPLEYESRSEPEHAVSWIRTEESTRLQRTGDHPEV